MPAAACRLVIFSLFLAVVLHMQIGNLIPLPKSQSVSFLTPFFSFLLLSCFSPSLFSSVVPYCLCSSVIPLSFSASPFLLSSSIAPSSIHLSFPSPLFHPSLPCFFLPHTHSLSSSSHSTYSLAINQPVILRHARWISLGLVANTHTHARAYTHCKG